MPITERLVLPVDVKLIPVAQLNPGMQQRLKAGPGDFALTRPRGRAHAKLVSEAAALLLGEFRTPRRIVEAVSSYAAARSLDRERVLAEAFQLLCDCFNDRYLVPEHSPDAASILPTREPGDRIGRFEVVRLVQLRDDTEVYQARGRDARLVAIKLARPGRPETGPLLAREAATLRRLRGVGAPHLVARGRHAGCPWLALSWCIGVAPRGECLELARDGASGRRALLALLARIARRYAGLHRRRVLHGDVHPENLLLGRRGEVTLLDFGLATPLPPLRLAGRAPRGAVAPFLAPEYAAALLEAPPRTPPAPTVPSEVHDVGSLLYLLATGSPYAEFELDREAMLRQILSEPPLPFARRGLAPWPALELVLGRALAKEPGERFASMAAFAAALGRIPRPAVGKPPRRPGIPERAVQRFLAATRDPVWAPPPPTGSVMLGAAGTAYALYRLACQRDDPEALAFADVWLSRVEASGSSPLAFSAPGTELVPEQLGLVSPFHTVSGMHLVRALIALAMGEQRAAEAAVAGFAAVAGQPCDALDLTLGRASVLLGCTLLFEALDPGLARSAALLRGLGDQVLAGLWHGLQPGDLERSGIAHGLGGILYATLRWARATGTRPPPGLDDGLEALAARAIPQGRGVRWAGPDSGEAVVGWCNGAAGLIHLWTLAHERSKRSTGFAALAEACAWSAWDSRSDLANLCCGLAGRSYGLLRYYQHSGAAEWRERAERLAGKAIASLDSSNWERPLSLFKGAAGIALLAADLERPEHAAMPFFAPEGWPVPLSLCPSVPLSLRPSAPLPL